MWPRVTAADLSTRPFWADRAGHFQNDLFEISAAVANCCRNFVGTATYARWLRKVPLRRWNNNMLLEDRQHSRTSWFSCYWFISHYFRSPVAVFSPILCEHIFFLEIVANYYNFSAFEQESYIFCSSILFHSYPSRKYFSDCSLRKHLQ